MILLACRVERYILSLMKCSTTSYSRTLSYEWGTRVEVDTGSHCTCWLFNYNFRWFVLNSLEADDYVDGQSQVLSQVGTADLHWWITPLVNCFRGKTLPPRCHELNDDDYIISRTRCWNRVHLDCQDREYRSLEVTRRYRCPAIHDPFVSSFSTSQNEAIGNADII